MLSKFSYLGVGLKAKTWKSRKIFILQYFPQILSNLLLCFSFFIFIARICNSLVQVLFPWFPWFSQFPSFRPGLILVLVAHTYTIHTCIYTFYIPILNLFYTRILYFFTVLHFNKKYIWFNLLFYTRFVPILLFAWQSTFQDITHVSLSRTK